MTASASHECPKYLPAANGKTCVHYLTNGSCSLPSEGMCVVWLRKQREKGLAPPLPPRPPLEVTQPEGSSKLAGMPLGVRQADIEDFKARGIEIILATRHRDVHIVPKLTGAPGRIELTYENLALLVAAKLVFPDAEITEIRTKDSK